MLSTCIGSELILAANSRLSFTANDTVMITGGRLFCHDDKDIAVIDTPSGKIALGGATVDVAVSPKNTVVIVVAGNVRLSNAHGSTLVQAGKRAIMPASQAPQPGTPVNIERETSWHYSLGDNQVTHHLPYIAQRSTMAYAYMPCWTPERTKFFYQSANGLIVVKVGDKERM